MKQNRNLTTMAKDDKSNMQWFTFDATGKTLGRFAVEIARVLRGRHKPTFTPHIDTGDGVIVINADKIVVTGAKAAQKVYTTYTGYPGGHKERTFREMVARKPSLVLQHAVRGMLPKNRLSRAQLKRLRVFAAGEAHEHEAQKPTLVNL